MIRIYCMAFCAILWLAPSLLSAAVVLHPLFSDNAVLQRGRLLPIWGTAIPGETVTVSMGEFSKSVVADAAGDWLVSFPPQSASTTPLTLTAKGSSTAQAKNILIGDVWLCGGQSNMGFSLGSCGVPDDVRSADFPLIRHFGVQEQFANSPQTTIQGNWNVCTPSAASGFSAVAFYFGRRIHAETGVPIGLLRSCVGGTNIELWISQNTLMNTPALTPYARQMRESLEKYRVEVKEQLPAIATWMQQSQTALEAGEPLPESPGFPEYPFGERRHRPRCVTLYNGMIAPLLPFALRGVIWYQGENNMGNAADSQQYLEKMSALVSSWRQLFVSENLPFYYVQLTSWQEPNPDPAGGDGWVYVREAQRKALERIPNTGMAVTIDVGDAKDIHPKNKRAVGERLAQWALHRDYGKNLVPSGPLYKSMQAKGNKIRVEFNYSDSGLTVGKRGIDASAESSVRGFAIAGADKKWHWANAQIDGTAIVVSHPDVPVPVAVRYAFSNNPVNANLYNAEGLPASPFRTDEW